MRFAHHDPRRHDRGTLWLTSSVLLLLMPACAPWSGDDAALIPITTNWQCPTPSPIPTVQTGSNPTPEPPPDATYVPGQEPTAESQ